MFRQVTLSEFKTASANHKRAVVFQEFPCDDITPTSAFLALGAKEGAVLLESAIKDQDTGRYSLIAIEPFAEFTSKGPFSELTTKEGTATWTSEPFEKLSQAIEGLRLFPAILPPLVGGAIGIMTYDAVRLFEEVPDRHPDLDHLPDLFFLFHSVHIAFDHMKGTLVISVIVDVSEDPERDYAAALKKIEQILKAVRGAPMKKTRMLYHHPTFFEEMSDEEFCDKVRLAKEHIRKGDAFQVVLSRTFRCPYEGDSFDVYRALRMANPSRFMFYIQTHKFAIAGASPERLVKVSGKKMQTMPMAGTRARVIGEEENTMRDLLQDPKEEAEHMMLVDLGRNDLGAVAKVGSVHVKELKKIRLMPHVMHIVSEVEGELAAGKRAMDALKAVFPAGTLTGAPKIRAMEIIDALETSRRGVYGGTICTIDNNGDLDSCIVIRTAFFKEGFAHVRAGAGIVCDSDPQKEAEETRVKAKGVIEALYLAMEGRDDSTDR